MWLALLALGLRLVFLILATPWVADVEQSSLLRDDAIEYHQLAINIVTAHQFALVTDGQPEALRTPLYPLFVAFWYAIFGPKPWLVLVAQCVFDSLACYLLYRAASYLVNRPAAVVAAVLYAVDPYVIFYTSRLLSEVLFNFLIVVLLVCVAATVRANNRAARTSALLAAGVTTGAAALVRPAAEGLVVLIACAVAVHSLRVPRRALAHVAVYVAVFALTISPWLLRNYFTFDTLALSDSDSYNLLALNVAPFEAQRSGTDEGTERQLLLDEADARLVTAGRSPDQANAFQKSTYWRQVALEHIARQPVPFGRAFIVGIRQFFFSIQASFYIDAVRLVPIDVRVATLALVADLAVSYALACLGILAGVKHRRWLLLLVAVGGTAYFALIAGVAGYARFRLPAIPFYLLLSGLGAEYARSMLTRHCRRHA